MSYLAMLKQATENRKEQRHRDALRYDMLYAVKARLEHLGMTLQVVDPRVGCALEFYLIKGDDRIHVNDPAGLDDLARELGVWRETGAAV